MATGVTFAVMPNVPLGMGLPAKADATSALSINVASNSPSLDGSGGIYVAEAGYAYGDPIAPAQIVRIGAGGSRTIVASQLQGPITDILWHRGFLYVS